MDINAALERMRALTAAPSATDGEADMSLVFEAIDGWLSKGGFLPDAWNRN